MPRLVAGLSVGLFVSALLLVGVRPVAAQPEAGTVFIGGGALVDVVRLPRSSGFGSESNADGSVPGGTLGVGVHLSRTITARFEWAMTDWLAFEDPGIYYPLYAPATLSSMPTALSVVSGQVETRRRTKSGFALLGSRLGSDRVSLELLGGIGWVAETTRSTYDFRIPLPALESLGSSAPVALPYPNDTSLTSTYRAVGVAGIDVAVALTEHAAVVPGFRIFGSGGGLSLRPGLGIRWTF